MIPVYNILIDEETGIDRISLVESPAVESNFLAFAKDKKQMLFTANEEQQMIVGVLMRADFPIYRYDATMGEYYIQFSKDTIKLLAEKLLLDNHQNLVNIEHLPNSDVDGVNMIELFIKDSSKGVNPIGFDDITDGSLFATFKVRNPKVWECIKNNQFKGFSIEGMFGYEQIKNNDEKVYNEIMNTLNKLEKMSKLTQIKAKLAQILLAFSTIKTDKAILEYDGEELVVDAEVFVTDENGERKPAEDGEYTTEDGTIITVKDGKVDTIVEVVEEPTEEEPVAEEELEEQPTEEEKVDELAELKAQVDELYKMVEKILEKIGEDTTKVEERLSIIEKMSSAKPVEDEMEVARTKKTTILNDKQKNRISELNKNWRAV